MAARVSGDREKGGSDRNQHGQGNNNEEWIEVNRNKNKNHNIQHGRFNGASGNNPSSRVSGNPNHKLLEKISTSVYITNLHWKATTKEIWDECAKWGTVVDIFISAKLSSVGARFGFVRFIRVRDVVNLITNLRTVWMGTFHIFADIARNQRGHKQSTSGKTQPQPEKGANGLGKSFAEALKHGTQGSGKTNQIYRQKTTSVHTKVNVAETSKKRSLELTSEDVMDLSSIKSSILAKVNEVQVLHNLYSVFKLNGFVDFQIIYVGGSWVWIDLADASSLASFIHSTEMNNIFSEFKVIDKGFILDEKVVWLDVVGLPLCAWTPKSLKKVGTLWGESLFVDIERGDSFARGKVCVITKHVHD